MTRDPLALTERRWQDQVMRLARICGWRCYHTWSSMHSGAGFPDLVLVKPPLLVFVELKRDVGKVTAAQQEWLDALAACGCEVAVWRPADLERVVACLERPASVRVASDTTSGAIAPE